MTARSAHRATALSQVGAAPTEPPVHRGDSDSCERLRSLESHARAGSHTFRCAVPQAEQGWIHGWVHGWCRGGTRAGSRGGSRGEFSGGPEVGPGVIQV